jgi:CheY-like chemotaxis protein
VPNPREETVHILVVDDDESVRDSVCLLLAENGYELSSAVDGFDALLQMKRRVPAVVISDLNMPHMSGFEFLSVIRRRFPEVLVVAMSGAYQAGDAIPAGVIADAFYAKGRHDSKRLLALVADLLRTSASPAAAHTRQSAPVWVPRNGKDARGIPYIVLTCTNCLRSFPLNAPHEATGTVLQTPCIFCRNDVRYVVDFSLCVISPKKGMATVFAAEPSPPEYGREEEKSA